MSDHLPCAVAAAQFTLTAYMHGWPGVHTHVSLARGVPQQSHGDHQGEK